ncbi:MAG TPA: sigma-70 family RNA polymerase sigma factor [Blastocatellia bacterium]|nr:sigma-70 family RNA polymerase sigma factor [Blastocatellia bacterium]
MQTLTSEWTVSELLERCSRQPCDNAAWAEFVRRYQSTIRLHVVKTFQTKSREELDRRSQFPDDLIEDLVQEVYKRLVTDRSRALKRFEGEHENSIYQYLIMISINVVRDHFREARAQKRPKVSESLDQLLETGDNALLDRAAIQNSPVITLDEIELALRKAVTGKNRERDMLIFKLRFYEGLTLEEITKVIGGNISAISIGSILNRMLKKLRRMLEQDLKKH